ncbi:hypothetical protein DSO57_1034376 [Entomophthora muscae]|uniref:Uncharacterized protein n=1 Tax=Entomophthora muscae TaxID=34485 RepID=A0ACC2REJ9_9FUNG|nr:hypothetical protein DSO57_1034376 [Entomophthora muscae]
MADFGSIPQHFGRECDYETIAPPVTDLPIGWHVWSPPNNRNKQHADAVSTQVDDKNGNHTTITIKQPFIPGKQKIQ